MSNNYFETSDMQKIIKEHNDRNTAYKLLQILRKKIFMLDKNYCSCLCNFLKCEYGGEKCKCLLFGDIETEIIFPIRHEFNRNKKCYEIFGEDK